MNNSKFCGKCKTFVPLSDFNKNKQQTGGYQSYCKQCAKNYRANYRIINIEKIRANNRKWGLGRSVETRKRSYEAQKNWLAEDLRRGAAHQKVRAAVKTGILQRQPCSVCGSEKSGAHHESYSHPLDVIWFCEVHHRARHKEMIILGIEA